MPEDQEPIVAPELEAPAIEADEPEAILDDNQTAPEEGEVVQPQEPEDDSEEFDWNGQKVRGPKGLKDGVLMHADYTRKTQALAEQHRQYQERETQLQQRFQQSDEELKARATLVNLGSQMDEYSKLTEADWQRLEQEDFVSAQSHWRRFQQLQGNYYATEQQIQQMQANRSELAKQDTARRLQETADYAKSIKGWTPQVDVELRDLATRELGFQDGEISQLMDPRVYRTLHLAWVGLQALNKQPAKPQQPKAEPLKVVSAKANPPARKDYGSMDMDEYVRARNGGRR